jgi:hypothetical protein
LAAGWRAESAGPSAGLIERMRTRGPGPPFSSGHDGTPAGPRADLKPGRCPKCTVHCVCSGSGNRRPGRNQTLVLVPGAAKSGSGPSTGNFCRLIFPDPATQARGGLASESTQESVVPCAAKAVGACVGDLLAPLWHPGSAHSPWPHRILIAVAATGTVAVRWTDTGRQNRGQSGSVAGYGVAVSRDHHHGGCHRGRTLLRKLATGGQNSVEQ